MNYDNARTWRADAPFVILTEGPMDVLKIGSPEGACLPGPAVALYGHSLSPHQKLLLHKIWRDKVIVLMLDADAYKDSENICKDLKASGRFKAVLSILLPDNRDPADCEHKFIWQLLHSQASAANINLLSM
jgi:DNA primase